MTQSRDALLMMGILVSGIFELAGGGAVSVVSARPTGFRLGAVGYMSHSDSPPLAVTVLLLAPSFTLQQMSS